MFQVIVPGKSHEDVGGEKENDSTHRILIFQLKSIVIEISGRVAIELASK